MDWTAYRRPSGKSHSALWTSPAGCSGSTWRQVFAPVIFRLLFNLGSIFDHNHGTSKKDSRGTQEPNNKSDRQSRRTSPLTAPWPVALLGSGVLLALSESSTERVAQVAGGVVHFTSTTTVPFSPVCRWGIRNGGHTRLSGKHGVIVRDHSTQRGRRWTPACGGHCTPPIYPVGMETEERGWVWLEGWAGRQARTGQESNAVSFSGWTPQGTGGGECVERRGRGDGAGLGCNIDVASFSGLACLEGWFGSGQPTISPSGQASLDGSIEAGRWMVPGGWAGVVLFASGEIADTLGLELPDLMDCQVGSCRCPHDVDGYRWKQHRHGRC